MYVATRAKPLATTITGSLPRPHWFTESLNGRTFLAAFNGDAAVGFSWSWFVAGSRATLLSRWKVDSPAELTLLTGFYSAIKPANRVPLSKARALHQSVMTLRQSSDRQHPYYWASFAMIGDAR